MKKTDDISEQIRASLLALSQDGKIVSRGSELHVNTVVLGMTVKVCYDKSAKRFKYKLLELHKGFLPIPNLDVLEEVVEEELLKLQDKIHASLRKVKGFKNLLKRLSQIDSDGQDKLTRGLAEGLRQALAIRQKLLRNTILITKNKRDLSAKDKTILGKLLVKLYGRENTRSRDQEQALGKVLTFSPDLKKLVAALVTDAERIINQTLVMIVEDESGVDLEDFTPSVRDCIEDTYVDSVHMLCTLEDALDDMEMADIGKCFGVILFASTEFWLIREMTDNFYGDPNQLVNIINNLFDAIFES